MPEARRPLEWGLIGALSAVALAVVLAIFLLAATDSTGDAVPRPFLIAGLYSTPGLVGLIGAATRRHWLLVAAALPLIPGAFLSFAGATLIFLVPSALMLAGAVRTAGVPRDRPRVTWRDRAAAIAVPAFTLLAAWASLFGLTESGCVQIPNGERCGTFTTGQGVLLALVCLVAALAIAAWAGRLRELRRGPARELAT